VRPGAGPYGITAGPDGALWFTLVHHGQIGRLAPGGDLTSHQLDPSSCGPSTIVPGPDGALWVALEIGAIARLAPAPPRGSTTAADVTDPGAGA
jgi:streptogramin lyase